MMSMMHLGMPSSSVMAWLSAHQPPTEPDPSLLRYRAIEVPGVPGTEWAHNAYIVNIQLLGQDDPRVVPKMCHSLSIPDFLPLDGIDGEWPVIGCDSDWNLTECVVLSSVIMPKHCDSTLGVFLPRFFPKSVRHIWFKSGPPAEWEYATPFTSQDITFHVPTRCGWEEWLRCQIPGTPTSSFQWLTDGTSLKVEAWTSQT